jgi:hypothetical protein
VELLTSLFRTALNFLGSSPILFVAFQVLIAGVFGLVQYFSRNMSNALFGDVENYISLKLS